MQNKSTSTAHPTKQSLLDTFFADHNPAGEHGRQALHSGAIAILGRATNVLIQILSTFILARLLLPEDFGIFAMMAALTSLTPVLMDLGTRDATVQKSRITTDEVSALFWLSLLIGLSLALATGMGSALIANFYHESRLEMIALVWMLNFILSALSLQHTALLRRAMMFDRINLIEIGSNLSGAMTAIVLAYLGWGYWALVVRPICASFLYLIGVWVSCPWIPGKPRLSSSVKEMVRFGSQITIFAVMDAIGRSADRIALGHAKGATDLGYYQNASVIYDNPLQIFGITVHTVAATALSKLRETPDELRRLWSRALSSLAFFSMPVFVILAVAGPDIVVLLLGDNWHAAGLLLTIMALRGPAHVIERSHGWLHVAAGKGDRWVRWGIISCVLQIVAVIAGMPYGSVGIATAGTILIYLIFIPAVAYSGYPFGIDARQVLRTIGPQLIAALCSAGTGLALRSIYLLDYQPLARVSVLFVLCLLMYLAITIGLFRLMEPLRMARSLAERMLPPQLANLIAKVGLRIK